MKRIDLNKLRKEVEKNYNEKLQNEKLYGDKRFKDFVGTNGNIATHIYSRLNPILEAYFYNPLKNQLHFQYKEQLIY